MRRMRYVVLKNFSISAGVVVTVVDGGSHRCVSYGRGSSMVIGASPSDVVTSDAADDELNDDDMDDDEFDVEEATRAIPIILERRDAPRRIKGNDEEEAMADDMLCYAQRRLTRRGWLNKGCSPALRGQDVK